MLESALADILMRVLGQYLQGIDRESVNFGAWSGLIELRNVALRPEALAVLFETLGVALPVTVESGFIGLLRLVVPWKSIGSSPVQIHMHDVKLVARPVSGDGSDDSQLNLRERRINRAKLNTDDAVREASWNVANQRGEQNTSSWSSWLVSDQLRTTIINNIQIHLCDIIIRFEDPFSNPESPYVASMECESLKIMSTDSQWREAFVEDSDQSNVHKLLEIKGFQVNWAPITSPASSKTPFSTSTKSSTSSETDVAFKSPELLRKYVSSSRLDNTSKASPNAARSLVHPVDGSMRLRISSPTKVVPNVEFHLQRPSADLDIVFPDVVVDLNDIQYACLVQTSLYFARIATRGFRPTSPKAYWKWAVDQLLPGCTARFAQARRFSPEGIAETRSRRDTYIAYRTSLLKARRTGVEEPKQISDNLEAMEDCISFQEILAYRDAADAQIEKDGQHWIPATMQPKDSMGPSESSRRGTTMSSFWSMLGYSENAAVSQQSEPQPQSDVTKEPVQSDASPVASSSPLSSNDQKTYPLLVLRAAFLLRSATVRLSQGGYPRAAVPRVEINFRNFRIGLLYSSGSDLIAEAVLGSFEAWDLLNNSRMVYSRSGMDEEDAANEASYSLDDSYPRDVTEAIDGIRSGLNPAKELLEDERNESKLYGDEFLDDDESTSADSSEFHEATKRDGLRSRDGSSGRERSPLRTYRITEEEFFDTHSYSNNKKYIAALRYTQLSEGNQPSKTKHASTLDVSVATMEAIVDGPKGAFVWGLKFWQPKGLVQDPILMFLGAAAGARIAKMRMELKEALLTDSVPMQVNAVILAPRFIIPSTNASSPSFVINMGTLGICTSDSSAHNHRHDDHIDEPMNLRYSNYVLTLDDLGIYFSPNLSTAVSCKVGLNTSVFSPVESRPGIAQRAFGLMDSYIPADISGVERIIRPFSLRFVLQTLRDSKNVQVAHGRSHEEASHTEEGIAKTRVRGNIPQLSLILTRSAFQLILTTAHTWAQGLRASEASQNEVHHPSHPEQEDVDTTLIFNKESESSQPDSNAPTLASYSVKVGVQSVSVEIRENLDVKLVTALASGLNVNVVKRANKNLRADLLLRSWSMTDGSRGSTAAFRRLLYSGTVSASEGVSPPRNSLAGNGDRDTSMRKEENFVSIRYMLNLSTFEQKVAFRFLSLHMNCVRETYLRLLAFFDGVRRHVKQHRRASKIAANSSQSLEMIDSEVLTSHGAATILNDASVLVSETQKLSVVSEFDGFTLQLVASGGVVAVFEMKDSFINFLRETGGSKKAWGSFGSFSVRDLTAPLQEHVSVLHYDRSSSISTMSPDENARTEESKEDGWEFLFPMHKNEPYHLNASFKGIQMLFLYRFAEVLQDYVSTLLKQAGPSLSTITEDLAHETITKEQSVSSQSESLSPTIFIAVDLCELGFRIPRHSSCLSEALTFKIKTFHVDNISEQNRMAWYARSDALQGAVEYLLASDGDEKSTSSVSSTFLNDCTTEMLIQPQSSVSSQHNSNPILKIASMNFEGPLCMNLSEAQYTVLYFVLTENFAETFSSGNDSKIVPDQLLSSFEDCSQDNSTKETGNVGIQAGLLDTSTIADALNLDSNLNNTKPTKKIEVHIPVLSVEVSRGWDVTLESSKILGIYLTNVFLSLSLSIPKKKVIEVGGTLHSVIDLRPESEPLKRNMVVHLASTPTESGSHELNSSPENVSVTYEKEGTDRPSIIVALDKLQLEMVPELLRDLTYMAIPGWPFLTTSVYAPDFQYIGRTINLVLTNSQVLLLSEEFAHDRRALVLTGEFETKMDWQRVTGAKAIVLQTRDLEVSALDEVPQLMVTGVDFGYGFKDVCALPFEKSQSPLIYPSDSEIEFIGPGYDDAGRRVNISVDAALCMLCTSEIPILKATMNRLSSLKPSYLSQRQWTQPTIVPTQSKRLNPKEEQKEKAKDNLKLSVNIPVSRYVVTDDSGGRFVPIVEVRLTSLGIEAHGKSMVQVVGQISVDLFNSKKGCWEPVVEPWNVSASLSRGQSGARAFILKSEERLNLNIAPTTIAMANTVGTVLSNAASKQKSAKPEGLSRQKSRREEVRDQSKVKRPSVAAFLVRNELGMPITMCLPGKSKWTSIQHNTEVEIGAQSESLVSSASEQEANSRDNTLKCSISIPSYAPQELSASEAGKHNVTFYPRIDPSISQAIVSNFDEVFSPLELLWDVETRNGVPVCTVRSPFRFVNKTKTTLNVIVLSKSVQMVKEPLGGFEDMCTIAPGEYFTIPAHDVGGVVHIRPVLSPTSSSALSSGKRPFRWSAALPKMPWLLTIAQERALLENNSGSPSARRALKSLPLVECTSSEKPDQGFFVKLVPSTDLSPDRGGKSPWLDVAIQPPITLTNKLPGKLSFQLHHYERASSSISIHPDSGGTILASGVINSLDDIHLHVSDEGMNSRFVTVAFDNGTASKTFEPYARPAPDEFGPMFSLGDINSGKQKAVYPSPAESEDLRGQTRKHFRANVRKDGNSTSKYVFYAGYWIRNRSDTAVEICSRPSFYGSGSISFYLRERPPYEQPYDYISCEGPFISVRLPSNRDGGFDNKQSNWWTCPSVLDEIDKPISISLPGRSLELEVRPSIGLDCGTHIVTIRNSSWIINSTSSILQWCQQSALDAQGNCPTRLLQSLHPGGVQGLHWSPKTSVRAIHLRLAEENGQSQWIWSPAIPLDIGNSRELPAKMYRPRTHDQYIARVASKEIAGSSRVLVVYEEDRQNPPYRIINMCAERAIAFSQIGSNERPWLVRAGKSTRYSWDDPLAPPSQRELSIRIIQKEELMGRSPSQGDPSQRSRTWNVPPSKLNIDKVGDRVMVLGEPYDPPVVFNVSVDGATKIITLFDEGADLDELMSSRSQSSSRRKADRENLSAKKGDVPIVEWDDISGQPASSDISKHERVADYPKKTQDTEVKVAKQAPSTLNAAIFLDSIGISIIDDDPEELLYFLSTGILLNCEASMEEQTVLLTVDSFQVDNQISKTPYPVLLWTRFQDNQPGSSEQAGFGAIGNHAFAIELRRDMTIEDILMVKSFQAQIRPFNISFEEGLVSKVLRLYNDSTADGKSSKNVESLQGLDEEGEVFTALVPGLSSTVKSHQEGSNSTSRRIYVHQFKIGTSEIRLTSAGSGAAIAKAVGLNASARAIVGLVLNVENCNFEFPALSVDNVFDSLHHFGVLIRTYYIQQLSNQRIKLLTSNSLVNPAALFNAVGTGARDFLNEPGRAKGSVDFLASVGRGSKSLFTHTVGGFVESVSSIPRAVSTGLERAVGDNDYMAERERIRGARTSGNTKNPAQGLATGALSLAHGISSGVAGFIREPVQGAKQGGAGGLLKGIGKALVGGVAKPVAGAMDLVAEPAAGLSRQIVSDSGGGMGGYANLAVPDRPPRAFRSVSRKIERYDRWYSTGVWLMNAVCIASSTMVRSRLVDWIELSDRAGRRKPNADLWVWYHVQRFSRYMPGMKKQMRSELQWMRQQQQQGFDSDRPGGADVLGIRPEKTRVALLINDQVMVVTLDCKLVDVVPLWEDAKYELLVDEKELLVSATVLDPRDDIDNPMQSLVWSSPGGGASSSSSSSFGLGTGGGGSNNLLQGVILAPWDVSAPSTRRRKPSPGQSSLVRIACGSHDACKDLRQAVAKIVRRAENERECKRKQAWLLKGNNNNNNNKSNNNDPMASGQELSLASQWHDGRGSGGGGAQESGELIDLGDMQMVSSSSTGGRSHSGYEDDKPHSLGRRREWQTAGGAPASELESEWPFDLLTDGPSPGPGSGSGPSSRGHASRPPAVIALPPPPSSEEYDDESYSRSRGSSSRTDDAGLAVTGAGGSSATGQEQRDEEMVGASEDEKLLQQLMDIGFKFEDAVQALADANGDIVKAVDLLT